MIIETKHNKRDYVAKLIAPDAELGKVTSPINCTPYTDEKYTMKVNTFGDTWVKIVILQDDKKETEFHLRIISGELFGTEKESFKVQINQVDEVDGISKAIGQATYDATKVAPWFVATYYGVGHSTELGHALAFQYFTH